MGVFHVTPFSPNPTASRRPDAANEHQRKNENIGFSSFRPQGKSGRMPELSVKSVQEA